MNLADQIRKVVSDLIKNPKKTISKQPSFADRTIDLYPQYQHKLTPEANAALAIKSGGMIHQYNKPGIHQHLYGVVELAARFGVKSAMQNPCGYTRQIALVQCFGFRCKPEQASEAADRLIDMINYLAGSQWINASLYNLGMLELGKYKDTDPDMVVVFSYLAVPQEHEANVKSAFGSYMFPEGGMPPEFR